MDGKQLKNSILQWAIQGKLVEQLPKEGSASDLYEKILAEKQALIKAGKLKKEKPLPPISLEDIPFEIPKEWKWCRIGDIFTLQAGKNIASSEIYNSKSKEHQYPCYGGNGRRGYVSTYNRAGHFCIIGRQGALCGNVNFANGTFYATEHAVVVDVYSNVDVSWSGIFLSALNLNQYATATAQPGLAVANINKVLIPLPPIGEQKRIVAKLEKLLPLIDEFSAAQEQLDKLNKELPEALKKSILQEAIQGKLVPQNPKDEPAQKLLERIAASRNESSLSLPKGTSSTSLRGARATKQSKNPPSRIYHENGVWYEQIGTAAPKDITDEIPFEIPETWAWCRLGNCSDYAASKEKAKSFENIQEMWSLDLEDIEKNSGRIVKRLKVRERKIVGEKVVFKKGQVLYSKLRPYLKKILVAPEDGVCSSEIVPFSPFEYLDADYLVTVLKSPHVDYTINLVTYGVKMPRVGTDTMLNLLIPLPPLAEQKTNRHQT